MVLDLREMCFQDSYKSRKEKVILRKQSNVEKQEFSYTMSVEYELIDSF